jgi:hypothetical protein
MIHLVTITQNLNLSECVQIWHIANKFQNHKVKYWIGLENNPDQHHLTSLITKLDWEKKNNPKLDFEILFKKQIYDLTHSQYDFRGALIEDYLGKYLCLDYVVYIQKDIIFSQQNTRSMWDNIERKTNWFGGGSLIYGKNLQKESEWIYLEDYPLIHQKDQIQKYISSNWPSIGIFEDNLKSECEYINWQNFLRDKYLEGSNMFYWEKNNVI